MKTSNLKLIKNYKNRMKKKSKNKYMCFNNKQKLRITFIFKTGSKYLKEENMNFCI